ncbi:MAG TPA: hypothetical protein PLQ56_06625 [Aggregatilineales bacterium]|nr:hypothetical protein [Aggregatilineales bacterium]
MVRKLKDTQRQSVAEKFMEWGNLVFAGLVIGQALSPTGFNLAIAFVGILLFALAYGIALRYMRGGE